MDTEMKACSKCKAVKAVTDFHIRNHLKGTRTSQCAECRKKHTVLPCVKIPTVSSKACSECSVVKDADEFGKGTTNKDGLQYVCKLCQSKYSKERYENDKERLLALGKAYRLANPEKVRDTLLRSCNGITAAQYDKMSEEQGGVCAICLKPPGKRRLAVDHSHETEVIRGLLCDLCNRGLGYLKDDTSSLQRAICYLKKHNL